MQPFLRAIFAFALSLCLAALLSATDVEDKLLDAARTGNTALVKELLAHGADPNTRDKNARTPLMEAAFGGYTDAVRALLDYGAHVDAADSAGWTPLFWAAFSRRTEAVRMLIAKGAYVDVRDNQQRTPLFWAASSGYTDIVRVLLSKGASVNARDNHGWTPLMSATDLGHLDTVRALLEKGADVTVRGNDGNSAQTLAEKYKYADIAALLTNPSRTAKSKNPSTAANPNPPAGPSASTTTTPEAEPVQKGRLAAANRTEASPATTTVPATPLSKSEALNQKLLQAAESGDTAEVLSLIREGAGVNSGGPVYGNTALIDAAARGYSETVRALLDKGAEVDGRDNAGRTALMEAAFGGYTDTARLLLEKGANINAADHEGWGPLFFAAFSRRADTVRFLLEKGAEVNAKNKYDDCALIQAAYGGDTETVKVLLEHHADINAKDDSGRTALMEAARQGHLETVRLLLQNGAAVDLQSKDGASALSLAAQQHHADIVALLKESPVRDQAKVVPDTTVPSQGTTASPAASPSQSAHASTAQLNPTDATPKSVSAAAFYRLGLSMRLVEDLWAQPNHVAEHAAESIQNDLGSVDASKDILDLAQQAVNHLSLPADNRKTPPPVVAALRAQLNQFCSAQKEGQFFFTLGEFTYELNRLGLDVTRKEDATVEEARLKDYLLATRFAAKCAAINECKERAFSYLSSAAEILQRSPLAPVDGATIRKISDNIGMALASESR